MEILKQVLTHYIAASIGALQAQISRVKKRNKEMRDLLERAYPFVAGFRDGPEYDDEAIVLGDSIIDALQAER